MLIRKGNPAAFFRGLLVIVDGNVTIPRLYFKTGRESFQLIRLLSEYTKFIVKKIVTKSSLITHQP